MYNKTVLDHLSRPRNTGKIEQADGTGIVQNRTDGDQIRITIRVEQGRISDIRFQTFGCGAAIAASSMVTVLAKGKTVSEARKIQNEDVNKALGGLPERKLNCSNVAADALQLALDDHEQKLVHPIEESPAIPLHGCLPSEPKGRRQPTITAEQTTRYLRQIIIPDIGASGQQNLMKSHVLVMAPSVTTCDLTLLYLAASGIGTLSILLEDQQELSRLLAHVRDLNPDISLNILDQPPWTNSPLPDNGHCPQSPDMVILTGPMSSLEHAGRCLPRRDGPPVLLGLENFWHGALKLCNDFEDLQKVLREDIRGFRSRSSEEADADYLALGSVFSSAMLGLLSVSQTLVRLLNTGTPCSDVLSFDLETLVFRRTNQFHWEPKKVGLQSPPDHWGRRLTDARVLLIGTGGLGSPVAYMLAKAGIGTLGLADYDLVELSNLNRQILHSTSRIGMRKTDSAAALLKTLFPKTQLILYPETFSRDNAQNWLSSFHMAIDGLDNLPGRYLLNDACYFNRKPFITAGVLTFYGLTTTVIPDQGPCYRCLFPRQDTALGASCSETGVLGPVPGLLGLLEALQAIGLILGRAPAREALLMFDALDGELSSTAIHRSDRCLLCGPQPSIHQLEKDYSVRCPDEKSQ